jgi:hypothetical protein
VLAIALVSCAAHESAPVVAPHAVEHGAVECALEGPIALGATPLYVASTGKASIGRLSGGRMRVRVEGIEVEGDDARARIALRNRKPGIVVRGFLGIDEIDLHTARSVPIIPAHVAIGAGEHVNVLGAGGGRVRIEPSYGAFRASVDVTCSMLTLDAPPMRAAREGERVHMATSALVLFDMPDGKPVAALPAQRAAPTFEAFERVSGMRRVRYEDGLVIDGWARESDLAAGDGPDCDDCHGGFRDIDDTCPVEDGSDDADGCPDVKTTEVTATQTATLRTSPSATGIVAGEIERGARAQAIEERDGFTHLIVPFSLRATLWVESSALAH